MATNVIIELSLHYALFCSPYEVVGNSGCVQNTVFLLRDCDELNKTNTGYGD